MNDPDAQDWVAMVNYRGQTVGGGETETREKWEARILEQPHTILCTAHTRMYCTSIICRYISTQHVTQKKWNISKCRSTDFDSSYFQKDKLRSKVSGVTE
jgi:hypothetical protein